MNTTRRPSALSILSARQLFAAAAIALVGSAAAVPALAQQATRTEVRAAVAAAQGDGSLGSVAAQWGLDTTGRPLNARSTATREDVRAQARQAVTSGATETMVGESYGVVAAPRTVSGTTRAEVRASTLQALRTGRLASDRGEGSGTIAAGASADRLL